MYYSREHGGGPRPIECHGQMPSDSTEDAKCCFAKAHMKASYTAAL